MRRKDFIFGFLLCLSVGFSPVFGASFQLPSPTHPSCTLPKRIIPPVVPISSLSAVRITLTCPSTGFSFSQEPDVIISGNHVSISLVILSPQSTQEPPVSTEMTTTVSLSGLSEKFYLYTVTVYQDGKPIDIQSESFAVDPRASVAPTTVLSAILPTSRSTEIGKVASAFAVMVNAGSVPAIGCHPSPLTPVSATFSYQASDPLTNVGIGLPNSMVNIPVGSARSFILSWTPTTSVNPTDIHLSFSCTNAAQAVNTSGLNTLLLSASPFPTPDIVALVAVPTYDGIVHLTGVAGDRKRTGVFAVASFNAGATAMITASVDTGAHELPIMTTLCQTDSGSGVCLSPPSPSVTIPIGSRSTPSFGVFVEGREVVSFNPVANRIFVRFKDLGGITRGSTSVAVGTF